MNAYPCPACGEEEVPVTADERPCPTCGAALVLQPDAETIWRGESIATRDRSSWAVKAVA